MEAIGSGMVRTVKNADLSSRGLLWGRQNERVVRLREAVVRKS